MRPGRGSGVTPLIYTAATSHLHFLYIPPTRGAHHLSPNKAGLLSQYTEDILTAFHSSEPVFNWLCAHLALFMPISSPMFVQICSIYQISICFWLVCVSYHLETKRQCQAESSPGPQLATLLTSSSSHAVVSGAFLSGRWRMD